MINKNGQKSLKLEFLDNYAENWTPKFEKNVIVFFQICEEGEETDESYMERIIWNIYDEKNECSSMKRFFTSYYPANFDELNQWIQSKLL